MGVMAGSSGLGLWFITLGNVAGALHACLVCSLGLSFV